MPKDRKQTYSDRQSQEARDKKQTARKKMPGEGAPPVPAPIVPKAKKKR